eukprot:scaffold2870_cov151-Skeletonema_dohrnii-CCMP3373.AAC.1
MGHIQGHLKIARKTPDGPWTLSMVNGVTILPAITCVSVATHWHEDSSAACGFESIGQVTRYGISDVITTERCANSAIFSYLWLLAPISS